MDLDTAKSIFFETREKTNALGLAFYLSSLDIETGTAPRGSMPYRSKQIASLSAMNYDLTTSDEYNEAVEYLHGNSSLLDEDFAHEIEITYKEIDDMRKIPKDEYIAFSELINNAYPVYVEAKLSSDFSKFQPYLDKIFDFNRKYGKWLAKDGIEGYDVLIDSYEHGYTAKDYDVFFAAIKEKLVPLIKKITEKQANMPTTLEIKHFPAEKQREFCKYLQNVMCFDPEYTVILESEHPFTTSNGNHDVRITNHYYEDNLFSSVFSAIHEMGHGLYELQIDDKFEGTGCSGGASLALHESQSRLMENMIGRSLSFWKAHTPKLRELFPEELGNATPEEIYKTINSVKCSLIRTEADEVTYPIHVLIRYEIEKDVMAGKLNAKDIPEAWNKKYKEYLGVDVPCDKEGCLQDVHWANGMLGYFPTYALGSAYAAQIYQAMSKDIDMDKAIGSETISEIASWLKDKLHKYGASKYPKELILLATGEEFTPDYYVKYLTEKYSAIYGI